MLAGTNPRSLGKTTTKERQNLVFISVSCAKSQKRKTHVTWEWLSDLLFPSNFLVKHQQQRLTNNNIEQLAGEGAVYSATGAVSLTWAHMSRRGGVPDPRGPQSKNLCTLQQGFCTRVDFGIILVLVPKDQRSDFFWGLSLYLEKNVELQWCPRIISRLHYFGGSSPFLDPWSSHLCCCIWQHISMLSYLVLCLIAEELIYRTALFCHLRSIRIFQIWTSLPLEL